ncbi:Tether containing UBX domain for GLUT4 [Merluccius polli]|uniref:Tether containing UBX domain for GLUT4 n=1 Tax=Merluccius polli TaxID=89951 RepID=A0AA47MPZ3_MERPO|nr:Tether containing UBX domain for GLUT4 [Merluccius polli]
MAASSAAVTVLTPNGRRQTVKVSPNTLLLQVLEDVCKKHEFNPNDHGLKFQRSVLDLTLQWRFASLPNNAKLEMVPSTRKQATADSQVRIGLQLEDGSRLQGSFSCGQNLWELITHFPETRLLVQSGSTPVCVYMRDKVSGEETLKTTTLKSLGLTSGSAIVRLLLKNNKTPEEDGRDAMETAAMAIAPVVQENKPNSSQSSDGPAASQPETLAVKVPVCTPSPKRSVEAIPVPAATTAPIPPEVPPATQGASGLQGNSASAMPVEDGERAGPSGLVSTQPALPYPTPAASFTPFSGGGQRLGGPAAGGVGHLLSSSASSSVASIATGGSPKAKKAKPSQNSNAKPVEREALIYHLDSGPQQQNDHQELTDEFFEVTVDDIRKRFAQLKSERRSLEETPLMTKALKESQLKEKMERYPKVVLRIQFPDRHVLQGFFRPLETVAAVRKFVRTYLQDPQLNFYLFLTPPKTILEESSVTLFQANLFPGALVYFGSDVTTDCYLQREHLNACVSAIQANESIAKYAFLWAMRMDTLPWRALWDPGGADRMAQTPALHTPSPLNVLQLTPARSPSGLSFQVWTSDLPVGKKHSDLL